MDDTLRQVRVEKDIRERNAAHTLVAVERLQQKAHYEAHNNNLLDEIAAYWLGREQERIKLEAAEIESETQFQEKILLMEERFERKTVKMLKKYYQDNPRLSARVLLLRDTGGNILQKIRAECEFYMDALNTITNLERIDLGDADKKRYSVHREIGVEGAKDVLEIIHGLEARSHGHRVFEQKILPSEITRVYQHYKIIQHAVNNVINMATYDSHKT